MYRDRAGNAASAVHVAAHAYVSHRTRCVSRSRRWRSIVSTRRRPLAPPACVSCVPSGSKVTGFAPGISEPSFVCVSQNPFLLTRATDVAGDTSLLKLIWMRRVHATLSYEVLYSASIVLARSARSLASRNCLLAPLKATGAHAATFLSTAARLRSHRSPFSFRRGGSGRWAAMRNSRRSFASKAVRILHVALSRPAGDITNA